MCKIYCYDSGGNVVRHLNQGDVDVSFVISGIESTVVPYLQIWNRKNVFTIPLSATIREDGSMIAFIPNALLAQAEVVIIYICQSTEDGIERTLEELRMHIRPAPRQRHPVIFISDEERVNL